MANKEEDIIKNETTETKNNKKEISIVIDIDTKSLTRLFMGATVVFMLVLMVLMILTSLIPSPTFVDPYAGGCVIIER